MLDISHRFGMFRKTEVAVSTSNFLDSVVSLPNFRSLYTDIRWNASSSEASRNTSSAFIRRLSLASR